MSDNATLDPVPDADEEPAESERPGIPPRIRLARFNYATMQDELVPVDAEVASEALRFLFTSSAWHDDIDLIRRKVRAWKERIYDVGWESEARKLRAENAQRWTFAKIARQLGVSRTQVRSLFVADGK